MGKKEERKFENIRKLIDLLLDHPQGLTKSEISRRLNVHRSTAGEYINDLGAPSGFNVPVYEVSPNRFTIDQDHYQVEISVNMHEALALHLATRLLTTRTDKHNPHAASALRRLGRALEKLAPLMSRHMKQSANVLDGEDRWRDMAFLEVLETLTRAWAQGQKVKLTHEMEDGQVFTYTFSPYFIEPYAIGRTMHVIGYREPPSKIRTLKVERIRTAKLLVDKPYKIPDDFDPRERLKDAWGIWFADKEPNEVVLQFSPEVAKRVLETQWHHNQKTSIKANGAVVWRSQVAAWREMLPWIRGWGADCEVLKPEKLRKRLEREAGRLAGLYGVAEMGALQPTYYAHSKENMPKSEWQKLKDHLVNTSELAFEFGQDAGVSELAQVAGLLHDVGKYSQAFQRRLEGGKRVDHATAGAKLITELFPNDGIEKTFASILSYCIAGHHTGLPNYGSVIDVETDGTLRARLKKKLEDYSAYKTEIDLSNLKLEPRMIMPIPNHEGFSAAFLTRMIYSALVDADYQETETYMTEGEKPRGGYANIAALNQQFNTFLRQFENPDIDINKKRTETLNACVEKAGQEPGFFTLTVPTGGGKTFASMAFALNHAAAHGMKRIIYVIPFTSIIEQNATEFKKCLGTDVVLEHHSNFDWEGLKRRSIDNDSNRAYDKLKLAAENWGIPVVVTTNVQFFESLFANRSSRCRKLHNIAKSVIIFDEAQMLPRGYLQPSMYAVQELVQNYGVSAVFCTATQPSLERFLHEIKPTELAPNPQKLFDFYQRVQIKSKGKFSDEELLGEISAASQALCIINTRKHAKGLFDGLKDLVEKDSRFHLSTLMCPVHRKEIVATIRKKLKTGEPCRVVSTQVMEAGIDLDFPVGYRAMAGLDSIIQAAGRVNREGENKERANVYVFDPDSSFVKRTPKFIHQGAEVARSILRDHADNPVSIAAINAYFEALYGLQDKREYDVKEILAYFDKGMSFDFKTAAENFKLIENNTVAVIIPYNDKAVGLLEKLRYALYPTKLLRELQTYTVNIYEQEFEVLESKGVIELCAEKYPTLQKAYLKEYYDPDTGIIIPEIGGDAIFF